MGKYLEMIENGENMISFSYNCGRGSFTLDLNNAVEMFTISDFKRFFAIADSSADGSFAIAEKVQVFTAARLEYEKSLGVYKNGEKVIYGQNEKLVSKLEKILVFLSDSFGISCDVQKPEKITKKRGTGLIFNVDECGRRYAEAVTGDFYNVGGIWYFIHKKPEIKRGGYVLSAAAYGSRVAAFGYFKTAKEAVSWIVENGISQKLLTPPAEGRARFAERRALFLEAVENSGLSWIIESNQAYFEDFLATAEAETPAAGAEMPQKAIESTTAANSEAEKTEEKPEKAPTECAAPAEVPTETKKTVYIYGMRLRGFSVGCQPAKFIAWFDDPNGRYYDILVYNRPLTADEMRHFSLDDLTGKIDIPAEIHITKAVDGYERSEDFPTKTGGENCGSTAGAMAAEFTTTAARVDRATRQKPHIKPKIPRCYISTIGSAKAHHGTKYAPTMVRHTPPISIGLQKMDFPGLKNGCFDQKGKIEGFSVKNRFGFCIGVSPPGGYQKILQ